MPGPVKITTQVDLRQYPQRTQQALASENSQLTLGDLHGNALKLLQFLLVHQVVELDKASYDAFTRLYDKKAFDYNTDTLKELEHILSRIKPGPSKATLRLIGDIFADRGKHDLLTLGLLERMFDLNIKPNILFSNHDLEFLRYLLTYGREVIRCEPTTSISSLITMIKNNLGLFEKVKASVEKVYLPCLKLYDYSWENENELMIYVHAPIQEYFYENLKAVAVEFKLCEQTQSIEELTKTPAALAKLIDKVNQVFSQKIKSNEFLKLTHKVYAQSIHHTDNPIVFPAWFRMTDHTNPLSYHAVQKDRDNENIQISHPNGNYQLKFTYGHDLYTARRAGVFCVDNMFGKVAEVSVGELDVLHTYNNTAPHAKKIDGAQTAIAPSKPSSAGIPMLATTPVGPSKRHISIPLPTPASFTSPKATGVQTSTGLSIKVIKPVERTSTDSTTPDNINLLLKGYEELADEYGLYALKYRAKAEKFSHSLSEYAALLNTHTCLLGKYVSHIPQLEASEQAKNFAYVSKNQQNYLMLPQESKNIKNASLSIRC